MSQIVLGKIHQPYPRLEASTKMPWPKGLKARQDPGHAGNRTAADPGWYGLEGIVGPPRDYHGTWPRETGPAPKNGKGRKSSSGSVMPGTEAVWGQGISEGIGSLTH